MHIHFYIVILSNLCEHGDGYLSEFKNLSEFKGMSMDLGLAQGWT